MAVPMRARECGALRSMQVLAVTWNPANPTLGTGAIDEAAAGLVPPDAAPRIRAFPNEWPREDRVRRRLWAMTAPYRAEYELRGILYQRTIWASPEEPFVYDGASVPRFVWSILAADKLHPMSGFHDEDYRLEGKHRPGSWMYWDGRTFRDVPRDMTRDESDEILRTLAIMHPEGLGPKMAATAETMLNWFGGGAWREKPGPSLPEGWEPS